MVISNYIKMSYNELAQEISKQRKKIESAKETIRLLEKLQLAEKTKEEPKIASPIDSVKGENYGGI